MPRLINVDALLNELQTKFDRAERDAEFTGSRVINISWNDAICAIKQAEIVEAISVEWLEKKIEKCKSSKDLYPQLFEEIMTIVIAEWRKENGKMD